MKLDDFVKKYNGKFIDAGGSANAMCQCVDVANLYIKEVLGRPKLLGANAIDFPKKAGNNYLWIENTPNGIPNPGDLVIFALGKYGHISIFISGNQNSFISFDQNYPLDTPAHKQKHTYIKDKVIGWLQPIKEQIMITRGEVENLENQISATDQHQHAIRWALISTTGNIPIEKEVITLAKKYSNIGDARKSLLATWAVNNGYLFKKDCPSISASLPKDCSKEVEQAIASYQILHPKINNLTAIELLKESIRKFLGLK